MTAHYRTALARRWSNIAKPRRVIPAMNQKAIADGLALVFQGIECLKAAFPHRRFTIDGRLVGDIGEVIAELEYDLVLHETSQPGHDANLRDGRKVQIKATFKESLTFKSTPDLYLGFKLYPDGRYEEVFNGPGTIIRDRYAHRTGLGTVLLSFPISDLRKLSRVVPSHERVPKRPVGGSTSARANRGKHIARDPS